ncbi:MAG: NAD-dependent epimerase/dehydratase family protein [Longimicrobiales bacterium]
MTGPTQSGVSPPPLSAYRGITTLVLGGSGFIGRWITKRLVGEGANVIVLARDPASIDPLRPWWHGRVQVMQCDVSDFGALREHVLTLKPAIAFNLAGYGIAAGERDAIAAQRLNADLVAELAGALADTRDATWSGQAIVHAGSSAEYGQTNEPVSGDGPAEPITDYGRSKLAGSLALARVCSDRTLPGVTIRLFMVYGAGEHEHRLFPSLIRAATSREAVALSDGRQRLDFTYVEDVAEGLLRAGLAIALPGEIVNLATGRLTQVRTFARTAAEILGLSPAQLRFGAAALRPDDVRYGPVRTWRFHQLTSWTPSTTIGEGIRRTLDHHATHAITEQGHR